MIICFTEGTLISLYEGASDPLGKLSYINYMHVLPCYSPNNSESELAPKALNKGYGSTALTT